MKRYKITLELYQKIYFLYLLEIDACESVQPRIIGGKDALPREKTVLNGTIVVLFDSSKLS